MNRPPLEVLEPICGESASYGFGVRLGVTSNGGSDPPRPAYAEPEHCVLVIGPPRSGKTTTVMIPNVVAACGPVISTSTKTDVMEVTALARSRGGDCFMFDPAGRVSPPPGVAKIAWSPLHRSRDWDRAMLMAETMVLAARPGAQKGDAAHWTERAQALLAPAFHAAALGSREMSDVVSLIDRREASEFVTVLAKQDAGIALHTLEGVLKTDEREQSGIWSTASSILAAYRSTGALDSSTGPSIDFREWVGGANTLYVCASSDDQRHAAPIVGGIIRDARIAAYEASAASRIGQRAGRPPLLLALDEVANIAPLHDLPALVSEGGGQGVVTLACVQDLSQVVERWGRLGEGFLSLFNTKLVFPGIGDTKTLEALSLLAGEHEVEAKSTSEGHRARGVLGVAGLRQPDSTTWSTRRVRRLPVDQIARGVGGHVVCYDGAVPSFVETTPWFALGRERATASRARGGRRL